MPEMIPLEVAVKLEKMISGLDDDGCAFLDNDDYGFLEVAVSLLRKIASGEYAPMVHVEPMKIKPTDTKALFERQCPKCDSLLFATDSFCGYCGAVMEKETEKHG